MMSDRVTASYWQAFLDRHPLRTYRSGEIIVFQGEAPRCAYVVKEGIVKAYNLSVAGDEKPIDFYAAGAIFPDTWVYGKVGSAIYYYEAFTSEVTVFMIDREELVRFVKSHTELLIRELDRSLNNQLGMSMRLNALQHSRASDKLLYTLHYLALTHGTALDKNRVEINLSLTHQDFANLTGLTRETAATELNKLKHKGVISYDKHQPYRLDLAHLMRLMNDEFIADLPSKL